MKIYEHRLHLGPGPHIVCLANGIVMRRDDEPLPSFASVPLLLRVELVRALRSLLDRWLDSGRYAATGQKDTDEPLKRSVYWQPPEHLEPLADVLRRWNRRHAANVDILRSGERAITMGKPKKEPPFEWARSLFGGYEPLPETEQEAREIAIYWLQELLDSPDRYRIARCDNPKCRRPYYMRQRARHDPIKNGTYCSDCKNVGSAVRVKASLERRKRVLIERAAAVWDMFKPSPQYPRKKDWVAMKVTRQLRLDKPLEGKWVTQNQKAIEAEVERRKHGTV